MPLTTMNSILPSDTSRGVDFWMRDGAKPVRVIAAAEAPANGTVPMDVAHIFIKHRKSIEQVASAKYDRGDLQGDGTILLMRNEFSD